jgi:rRNA-processing protein FCF1
LERADTYEKTDRVRNSSVKTGQALTILLDTSFLLAMLEQRRDIEEELRDLINGPIRIATLDMVERELQRIGRTRASKIGAFANAALELLKVRKYSTFSSGIETSDTDAAILSFSQAQNEPLAVATIDRKLRVALSKLGIATIYPRRHRGLLMSKTAVPVRLK